MYVRYAKSIWVIILLTWRKLLLTLSLGKFYNTKMYACHTSIYKYNNKMYCHCVNKSFFFCVIVVLLKVITLFTTLLQVCEQFIVKVVIFIQLYVNSVKRM